MAFGNLALEPKKQNDQHERERESKKEQKRGIAKLSTWEKENKRCKEEKTIKETKWSTWEKEREQKREKNKKVR